jgi:hypothetical protein
MYATAGLGGKHFIRRMSIVRHHSAHKQMNKNTQLTCTRINRASSASKTTAQGISSDTCRANLYYIFVAL